MLAVAAPVVLQVIKAPLGVTPRVQFLVLVAALVAGAGLRPGRGVKADLQALAVDVIGQRLHVGELLVGKHVAVRVPPGFPAVVNVDVGPAVVDQAAGHHRVRRGAHVRLVDVAAETIPAIPAHRRRQRDGVAADDLERPLGGAARVLGAQGDDVGALLLQDAGDEAALRINLQPGRQVPRRKWSWAARRWPGR